MTCTEFEQRLDALESTFEMNAHRAVCTGCARSFAAMAAIEAALHGVVPATVSADFNDTVMRQIHSEEARRRTTIEQLLTFVSDPVIPVMFACLIVIALNAGPLTIAATTITRSPGGLLCVVPAVVAISWLLFRAFATAHALVAPLPSKAALHRGPV